MKPNAELYNGDHQHFADLVDATGMSKRAVARALGIGYSTLRCYLDGTRTLTYVVQYAVEQLANSESKIKLTGATKMKLFNVASGIIDSGVLEIEIHFTIEEAKTALQNSGVVEMFGFEQLEEVAKWMYKHDASAESAAKYFKVI